MHAGSGSHTPRRMDSAYVGGIGHHERVGITRRGDRVRLTPSQRHHLPVPCVLVVDPVAGVDLASGVKVARRVVIGPADERTPGLEGARGHSRDVLGPLTTKPTTHPVSTSRD